MSKHIILSRRNIEALLHMLDNRTKQRPALVKGDGVVVEAQEDDEHYRGVTPGVMSWERVMADPDNATNPVPELQRERIQQRDECPKHFGCLPESCGNCPRDQVQHTHYCPNCEAAALEADKQRLRELLNMDKPAECGTCKHGGRLLELAEEVATLRELLGKTTDAN